MAGGEGKGVLESQKAHQRPAALGRGHTGQCQADHKLAICTSVLRWDVDPAAASFAAAAAALPTSCLTHRHHSLSHIIGAGKSVPRLWGPSMWPQVGAGARASTNGDPRWCHYRKESNCGLWADRSALCHSASQGPGPVAAISSAKWGQRRQPHWRMGQGPSEAGRLIARAT